MKRFISVAVLAFVILSMQGQELYVSTEPASNMPAKSFGFRLNSYVLPGSNTMFRCDPEFMWGIHKNWMLHFNLFGSNMHQSKFVFEGANMYAKYRFLSIDDLHSHFRMAVYSRASLINNPIRFNDINLSGDNSGISGGIVATQLLHKLALSVTVGYTKAFDNLRHQLKTGQPENSINYSLSAGHLILPVHYVNFDQPNFNIYFELLGKYNPETQEQYIDLAPALQVILKSKIRIDVAYQKQVSGDMLRISKEQLLIRFEYNLFNAYK